MITIRQAKPSDLDALYRITLKTGDSGQDASSLFANPDLLGDIYSAPYLALSPKLCFVAEQKGEALGFCVGADNTRAFEESLELHWWPGLRRRYERPAQSDCVNWTADDRLVEMIYAPETVPAFVADRYPAHLHMNLMPTLQGQGIGARMFKAWKARASQLGATAVHIGASPKNTGAVEFWKRCGFTEIGEAAPASGSGTVWMGHS